LKKKRKLSPSGGEEVFRRESVKPKGKKEGGGIGTIRRYQGADLSLGAE